MVDEKPAADLSNLPMTVFALSIADIVVQVIAKRA